MEGQRSEHVGISNEKTGEIPVRRKPKGSERTVHPLRVSRYPKPRPKRSRRWETG